METKLTQGERQKIESYILNELNPTERSEWSKKIKSQNHISEEYERQKLAISTLEAGARRDHKAEMAIIHKELFGHEKLNKRSNPKWILILMILLLVGGACMYFLPSKTNLSTVDEIYLAYYEPIKLSTQRSNSKDMEFYSLYENQEYSKLLALESKSDKNNPEHQMALGIAALNSNAHDKAKSYFNQIIESENMYYTESAIWYVGLTHLKAGKLNEAKIQFNMLVDKSDGDFTKPAQKIISQINNLQ